MTTSEALLAGSGSVVYDRGTSAATRRGPAGSAGARDRTMVEEAERDAERNEARPPDDVLLMAVRGGNEAALRSLYERYADLVYTVALRIVGDRELAQEVLQDVFLRCWERADTFESQRGHLGG